MGIDFCVASTRRLERRADAQAPHTGSLRGQAGPTNRHLPRHEQQVRLGAVGEPVVRVDAEATTGHDWAGVLGHDQDVTHLRMECIAALAGYKYVE